MAVLLSFALASEDLMYSSFLFYYFLIFETTNSLVKKHSNIPQIHISRNIVTYQSSRMNYHFLHNWVITKSQHCLCVSTKDCRTRHLTLTLLCQKPAQQKLRHSADFLVSNSDSHTGPLWHPTSVKFNNFTSGCVSPWLSKYK